MYIIIKYLLFHKFNRISNVALIKLFCFIIISCLDIFFSFTMMYTFYTFNVYNYTSSLTILPFQNFKHSRNFSSFFVFFALSNTWVILFFFSVFKINICLSILHPNALSFLILTYVNNCVRSYYYAMFYLLVKLNKFKMLFAQYLQNYCLKYLYVVHF